MKLLMEPLNLFNQQAAPGSKRLEGARNNERVLIVRGTLWSLLGMNWP